MDPDAGVIDALSLYAPKAAIAANLLAGVIDAFAVATDPWEGAADARAGVVAAAPVDTDRALGALVGATVIETYPFSTALVRSTAGVETEVGHALSVTAQLAFGAPVGAIAVDG